MIFKLKIFNELKEQVDNCKLCDLYQLATNSVMFRGNINSKIVFLGEGPGQNEDQTGLPFVGRAGRLLDNMINAMDLSPNDVFITNVVKHRPPNNRKPSPKEMLTCLPFLEKQLDVVKPEVIITLGATATEALLGGVGIVKRRGIWGKYKGISVLPTFHPSACLRNPKLKHDVWQDLQKVMKFLEGNKNERLEV